METRNTKGQFLLKGEQIRQVRTLRVNDCAWEALDSIARDLKISKADLIERIALREFSKLNGLYPFVRERKDSTIEATKILQDALELKANAGGKIKTEIKRALQLLNR